MTAIKRLFFSIKENRLLRLLVLPYKRITDKLDLHNYQKSSDAAFIRTLKGVHSGERCFILGNGPSLSIEDLNKLHAYREITLASNSIFRIFDKTAWRPDYFVAVDLHAIDQNRTRFLAGVGSRQTFLRVKPWNLHEISNGKCTSIFEFRKYLVNYYNDISAHIPIDVASYFSGGGATVTFTAIQLAIYMGFKQIVLLGVDHSYTKYIDSNGKIYNTTASENYFYKNTNQISSSLFVKDNVEYAYKASRDYCDANGMSIQNATRGGKLEIFDRVDFDELFTYDKLSESR